MATRKVKIGRMTIGGGLPVVVQSMTNTDTRDVKATLSQIRRLEDAGCEIVRVSVPDAESVEALKRIRKKTKMPLVADIHFDYRLAIESMRAGADKIRINPGNIGTAEKVTAVIEEAKRRGCAIRIGVNSGSLKKGKTETLKIKSKNNMANEMVSSLMEFVEFFEMHDFENLAVSLKASDIPATVEANRLFSKLRDYPLHIGITEAGTELSGTIKSAAGIGILLYEGIGDTIRVSLTAEPEKEVYVAYRLLDNLGLRKRGVEIISCPTCARTEVNVIKMAKDIENMTMDIGEPIKIAVMGCVVNGPGEASHADLGVSGGKKIGLIFVKGKIIKKVPKKALFAEFKKELNRRLKSKA